MANKLRVTDRSAGDEAPWGLDPLSPRSIVLSVLLGSHPPEMRVGRLLEFTSLFDIADGTVRTALSRLVATGDLVADDGVYRLSPRLSRRQVEQDAGRLHRPATWDGTWWIAAVTAERRPMAARRQFRSAALGARLGELRPDLWLRPANIDVALDLPDVLLSRGSIATGAPDELVARLWDLARSEQAADDLLGRLDAVDTALGGTVADEDLAPAFVTLAACQRFLRTEPQLPAALSPGDAAERLRTRYDRAVDDFQTALSAFFRNQLSTGGR